MKALYLIALCAIVAGCATSRETFLLDGGKDIVSTVPERHRIGECVTRKPEIFAAQEVTT